MNAFTELSDPRIAALAASIRDLCGDDDLAFIDTLDGAGNSIDAAREVVRFLAATEALESAAKALSARYQARAQDFASRQERARSALLHFMGEIGERTLVLPEGTVSVKASGARKLLGDGDPLTMPREFVKTKQEVDRAAVKRALEQGVDVDGFALSNSGPSLAIRK